MFNFKQNLKLCFLSLLVASSFVACSDEEVYSSPNEVLALISTKGDAVDLGLSVKWASKNIGACTPDDNGAHFAWGEIAPKSIYSWSSYKYCNDSASSITKYCTSSSYGTVDNMTVLKLSDDAARANWDGKWRIPTDDEWKELLTKCTWTWTTVNGKNGYKVTASNGNYIFLPAAGFCYDSLLYYAGTSGDYWSSTLSSDNNNANFVYFGPNSIYMSSYFRYSGRSIRPVLSKKW